jgi:hypothetical protein
MMPFGHDNYTCFGRYLRPMIMSLRLNFPDLCLIVSVTDVFLQLLTDVVS